MDSATIPTMAYYKVYVAHPWGTDALIVSVPWIERSVEEAAYRGWERACRLRFWTLSDECWVKDVVPMKYIKGKLTETRKMRVESKAKFKNARRPKSRVSRRSTRR